MRTTDPAAFRTPSALRISGSGRGTSAARPLMLWSGSTLPSALRIGPDGGSALLRSLRITERAMLRRTLAGSLNSLAVCCRTEPTIQTKPSPIAADSTAPASPSISRKPGSQMKRRTRPSDTFKDRSEEAADDHRAAQSEQRRVRRPGPLGRAAPARCACRGRPRRRTRRGRRRPR